MVLHMTYISFGTRAFQASVTQDKVVNYNCCFARRRLNIWDKDPCLSFTSGLMNRESSQGVQGRKRGAGKRRRDEDREKESRSE